MLLNIKKNTVSESLQAPLLFNSAKACYVIARLSLLMFCDFRVPGFMLMQQAIENLIKSLLKKNNVTWKPGKNGHDFIKLLELGSNKIPLFETISKRTEFCDLLNQLQDGYTAQRYGESGHFVKNFLLMMNLFDELSFLLIEEYGKQSELEGDNLGRLIALPIPSDMENTFIKDLKQPFVFTETFSDAFERKS